MPGPRTFIRVALAPPLALLRRVPYGDTVAGLLQGVLEPRDAAPAPDERVHAAEAAGTPSHSTEQAVSDALDRRREPVEEAAPPVVDPAPAEHVESEVEVVAESADAGATEPPGPEIHVDEPWEGYRRMKADEVITRLDGQPAEVLAAVELFETTHRSRRTVLAAAERELKRVSGPATR